jgi:carboxymethylenebutenolidase
MERKKATDYPQEIWYLLENFNHGFISRREFIERAGKYAVGGLTAAALLDSLAPNYALGQQIPEKDSRINRNTPPLHRLRGMGRFGAIWHGPQMQRAKCPPSSSSTEPAALTHI